MPQSPSADREVDLVVLRILNKNASIARLTLTSTKTTTPMGWFLISLAKTDPLRRLVVRLSMTEVLLDGTHDEPVAVLEDEITIDTVVDPIAAVHGAENHGENEIATEMISDISLMDMSSKKDRNNNLFRYHR